MGDTAVAVNPKDPRYAEFIGLHIRRPLPLDIPAELPIIGDEAVEFEFGTGVLKVTPAHDKTDYEIGLRHGLPVIDILNPDGTLNDLAGEDFAGLDRFEARAEAIEKLRELGILVKEEPHENHVGFSERADVPVEPRLSEQWFLKYPKTAEARAAVRDHLIRFFPDRWEKVFDHWLENIQDWCISRQLWWGHRIPVWVEENGKCEMGNAKCPEAIADGEAGTLHSKFVVSVVSPGEGWVQDPDVLDTWFSSWLWAHETMDAAAQAKFYPTSALVTGPDIIFFWVARMIMAGLEYTGEIPFRSVYFTGIIRDRQGRKMSKSRGNSPDPLDLISKFGADGLRFGLLRIAPQGQDIKFDEQQIVEGRNFCNKLWNACRFRLMQGPVDPTADPTQHDLSIFSRDLLAKLDATIARVDSGYEAFRFSDIAQALYDFVWGDFCDRFIEAAKADFDSPRRAGTLAVMDFTIQRILKLLHPYTPFITEELWSGLGFGSLSLMQTPWPEPGQVAPDPRADAVYAAVSRARNLRATYNVPSNKRLAWQLAPSEDWVRDVIPTLALFLHAESLAACDAPPSGYAACPTDIGILYLPLEGVVDASSERQRLQGEMGKVSAEIEKVARKLASETFVNNAPPAVVAEHRQRQQDWLARLAELESAANALG
jgi:valyl-tRNA synthetase